MASQINDENNESCNDFLHPTMSVSGRIDSGYLTFISPCRLSPSIVIYNENDSPISEYESQSPINPINRKFFSTIDYENYVSTRKYFDILTQLYHRNTYHLIDEILKYLTPNDFSNCYFVCKTWNLLFKDYNQRKQTKNVKRKLFNDDRSNEKYQKLTSTPMQPIANRIHSTTTITEQISNEDNRVSSQQISNEDNRVSSQQISNEDNIHLTASTMTFRYGYLKYLHGPTIPKRCPICSFVSIVDVNDQHGICTNPLCQNSFCQHCSGPYHPKSPCKTTIGPVRSPWRKRVSISPIFSNKTRNNLRRLLLR